MITIETIVNELDTFPQELLVEVLDFIRTAKTKNIQSSNKLENCINDEINQTILQEKKVLTARQLLNSNLIGLWENRIDITDSLDYARQLREKAQRRDYDTFR
jgi:uncharacterized membrane-anchored protein